MASILVINPGNTMIAEVQARSSVSGLFVNGGSGSITFRDKITGATVIGPIAMPYVSGSAGRYRCTIPSNANFVLGRVYVASVSVSQGSDVAAWEEEVTATQRAA